MSYRKDENMGRPRRTMITANDYEVIDRGHTSPCWIFRGGNLTNPYGTIRFRGEQMHAHRASYIQEYGTIPNGLQIDHLCRQTHCVRPDHLAAVTPAANSRRKSNILLTMEDADAIRASAEPGAALARRYGVSESLVSLIRRDMVWKHVTTS